MECHELPTHTINHGSLCRKHKVIQYIVSIMGFNFAKISCLTKWVWGEFTVAPLLKSLFIS